MSHFSLSANSRLDPLTIVREFNTVADGFLAGDGTRWEAMVDSVTRTRNGVRLLRRLDGWFGPTRKAAITSLTRAAQVPAFESKPAKDRPREKRKYVAKLTKSARRGPMAAFETALHHPDTGYRPRLIELVCRGLHDPPRDPGKWDEFDEAIAELAAVVLGEGRDGSRQAESLAAAFSDAQSTDEAEVAFRGLLNGQRERFMVAFVLQGAKRVRRLDLFGCREIERSCWPESTDRLDKRERLNRQLARFIERHTDGVRACGFAVEVAAWDPGHAWTLASQVAAEVRDQVSAEHRVAHFTLAPEVAVLDIARARVVTQRRLRLSVAKARTLTAGRSPHIREALRFHALAQEERAPVVSVLHSWIALEQLAHDAKTQLADGTFKRQGAGEFLPLHLAAVMALASARAMLASSWHVVRRYCQQEPKSARGSGSE